MRKQWSQEYVIDAEPGNPLADEVGRIIGIAVHNFAHEVGHDLEPSGLSLTVNLEKIDTRPLTQKWDGPARVTFVSTRVHYEEDDGE